MEKGYVRCQSCGKDHGVIYRISAGRYYDGGAMYFLCKPCALELAEKIVVTVNSTEPATEQFDDQSPREHP